MSTNNNIANLNDLFAKVRDTATTGAGALALVATTALVAPAPVEAACSNGQTTGGCGTVPAPTPIPSPSPSPAPAPVTATSNSSADANAAAIAAAIAKQMQQQMQQQIQQQVQQQLQQQQQQMNNSGNSQANGGAGGAGGAGGSVGDINAGQNIRGGDVNINNPRNAPGIAPAAAVGAGVTGCYDKNGYAFGVSTVYKLAAATVTFSTDAKEIEGCHGKELQKIAGTIGFSSDDPAKAALGAKELGIDLGYLDTKEGQSAMSHFGKRNPAAPAPKPATGAAMTFVFNGGGTAPAQPALPPCVIPGHKASWKQVPGVGLACTPDNG